MPATQAHYRDWGKMDFARSVLVVHNMAHQGRGPMAELPPLEVSGCIPHWQWVNMQAGRLQIRA